MRYRVAEKPFCLYYFTMLIEERKRIVNSIIRNERGKIAVLPYALTWSRLPLAVAFYIAVTSGSPLLAVLFLILAGLSDFLDGFFARKYIGHGTAYGPVLDPIVDKTCRAPWTGTSGNATA